MFTVYVHKNLKNEKYYVGATKQNPKARWKNGKGYQRNPKMWADIQNSDWNKDWVHGILGKFENEQDALKYEAFLIAMLGSVENGYNKSSYDSMYYERTEEHRRKISETLTGHEVSEVTRNKISKANTGEKHPNFGKHLSEETKRKISETMTGENAYWFGKHLSEEHRKKMAESKGVNGILQFSKTGELVAEYPSLMEAERNTGCNHGHICECCKGKLRSTGGFIWKYKEYH